MVDIVQIEAVPNQAVTVTLGGQPCQIDIMQKRTGLFLNLWVNGSIMIAGALCQDRNRIVRSAYFNFIGDLMFYDTQGASDPISTGLGTRFLLAYVLPGELP